MHSEKLMPQVLAPPTKNKSEYINSIQIGVLVAFNAVGITLSGKVDLILEDSLSITTKNGKVFSINKKDVIWVKTGDRWPKGVYNALKGRVENNGINK